MISQPEDINFECALSQGFVHVPDPQELIVIDFNDDGWAAVSEYIDAKETFADVFDPHQTVNNELFTLFEDSTDMNFDKLMQIKAPSLEVSHLGDFNDLNLTGFHANLPEITTDQF